MLRDVRVSPDGKPVVYSALGQLYARGAARRRAAPAHARTTASSSFRRSRATASGSSTRRGATPRWAASASCGPTAPADATSSRSRDTTSSRRSRPTASGSCSATPAAIRRAARTSPTKPASTSCRRWRRADARARRAVPSPEFDHTGTRIYLREVRNEKFTLLSVGLPAAASPLPGRDEIEHVRSDNATQIVPSPDGKWVAFEERFRTYHRAVPAHRPAGRHRSDDAGVPGAARLARRRASTCTGRATAAGCTGRLVRSSSRASCRAPSRSSKARRRQDRPNPRRKACRSASRSRATGRPASIALVGARVITMAGLKPGAIQGTPGVIENATIVIEGNRITAIGPSSSVQVPAGCDADRRQGQDDHAGHHRRARASRRRVERARSRNRAGRWRPTSRSASRRRTIRRTTPKPCSPTPS